MCFDSGSFGGFENQQVRHSGIAIRILEVAELVAVNPYGIRLVWRQFYGQNTRTSVSQILRFACGRRKAFFAQR